MSEQEKTKKAYYGLNDFAIIALCAAAAGFLIYSIWTSAQAIEPEYNAVTHQYQVDLWENICKMTAPGHNAADSHSAERNIETLENLREDIQANAPHLPLSDEQRQKTAEILTECEENLKYYYWVKAEAGKESSTQKGNGNSQ